MEVLQDTYKDTKVGRIPKDWEVRNFNKCCGINKDSLSSSTKEDYSFYYLDLSLVKKGIIDFPNSKVDFRNAPSRARRKIKKGDILMSTVRPNLLGNAYINFDSEEYIASTGFAILSNYKETNGEFLYHYLYSHNMQSQIERMLVGSSYPAINNKDVSILKIPVPPLPEQQKIAAILSTVDEQISTTDKIIEKSKELKKGLMQRFFLNKAYMIMSLGKLEKTELMPIRFNQLGKILTGTTPPTANKEYYDTEDYMFIGPADLGKVKDVKNSKKYISVKGFDVTRKLPENALMVVCIGATIGKIGLTTEPCATNQQVNTIVPKDEYSARYLYYVIGGLKKYLLGFAGDTATPQLNKTDFGKVVTFIHKSKSERTKIAAILSEADAKIEKEQEQKTKLEQLKKGLMQQLLTGKKRVKV